MSASAGSDSGPGDQAGVQEAEQEIDLNQLQDIRGGGRQTRNPDGTAVTPSSHTSLGYSANAPTGSDRTGSS